VKQKATLSLLGMMALGVGGFKIPALACIEGQRLFRLRPLLIELIALYEGFPESCATLPVLHSKSTGTVTIFFLWLIVNTVSAAAVPWNNAFFHACEVGHQNVVV